MRNPYSSRFSLRVLSVGMLPLLPLLALVAAPSNAAPVKAVPQVVKPKLARATAKTISTKATYQPEAPETPETPENTEALATPGTPQTAGTPSPAPDFTGADKPYRAYWRLHYGIEADFPRTKDADFDTGRLARIRDFLNNRYKNGKVHIVDRNTLALQADTPADLVRMKHDLVEWDRTWPQVRLDVYALQLAGNEKTIAENRLKVNMAFDKAQQAVKEAMTELIALASQARKGLSPQEAKVWDLLELSNFNTSNPRQMTLPEALLFISLLSDRETRFRDFQTKFLRRYLEIFPERAKDIKKRMQADREARDAADKFMHENNLPLRYPAAPAPSVSPERLPFSRLAGQFTNNGRQYTLASLADFLTTWALFQADESPNKITLPSKGRPVEVGMYSLIGMPDALRLQAQKGDVLFEEAITDLAADLKELIYEPLLLDLKNKSAGGIDLVAQNSLVITSTLDGALGSNGDANFRVDLPQKLTPQQFRDTLGDVPKIAASLGAGAASAPITAGATLGALKDSEAFTNALLYESDPQYAGLKPKVRVDARPTVQGDGTRARLRLKVTASVGVQPRNADGKIQMGPIDHVETQEGTLDSTIQGLDLLQVAATSLSVSHPRPKTGIPVLSRIPVLGDAFSWKRGAANKGFETRVIANALIIPRSLDLIGFYGSSGVDLDVLKEIIARQNATTPGQQVDTASQNFLDKFK